MFPEQVHVVCMPEDELRGKSHGLYDSFFLWGLWTPFQKAEGYGQAAKANAVYPG